MRKRTKGMVLKASAGFWIDVFLDAISGKEKRITIFKNIVKWF